MQTKLRARQGLAGGVLGLVLLAGTQTVLAGDIGPLPTLKFDAAKAELGKRMFFDRRLSGDAGISCADCHKPANGFGGPDALSPGYPGNKHFRNAPTLINTAHKKVWMWDGRIGTDLNDVTREMLTESYIMNMDMRLMHERAKQDPEYLKMFAGKEPTSGGMRGALEEYMKSLTSRNVPFDQDKLSGSAKRGMALFKGKAGCAQCHNGANFTDNQAHNTGVAENPDVWLDPMRHQAFIAYTKFLGVLNYMNLKRDPGAHVQFPEADGSRMGTFVTPTLRELKHTAPYMHNGMVKTLDEVVEFYNRGGGKDRNKSAMLKPLNLSGGEKKDLVDFLLALSGDPLTGPEHVWKDPIPESYSAIQNWRDVKN